MTLLVSIFEKEGSQTTHKSTQTTCCEKAWISRYSIVRVLCCESRQAAEKGSVSCIGSRSRSAPLLVSLSSSSAVVRWAFSARMELLILSDKPLTSKCLGTDEMCLSKHSSEPRRPWLSPRLSCASPQCLLSGDGGASREYGLIKSNELERMNCGQAELSDRKGRRFQGNLRPFAFQTSRERRLHLVCIHVKVTSAEEKELLFIATLRSCYSDALSAILVRISGGVICNSWHFGIRKKKKIQLPLPLDVPPILQRENAPRMRLYIQECHVVSVSSEHQVLRRDRIGDG